MYVGNMNHGWDSWYVDIPDETKEKDIHEVSKKVLLKELEESKTNNIAFCGVLNYNVE